jgi:glucose/arabinose dehydrogenase
MRLSTTFSLCACILGVSACGSSTATDDAGVGGEDAADAASPVDARQLPDAFEADCTPQSGTTMRLEEVATGLDFPVFAASPPGDARLFVLEQPGRIRIIENGQLLATPFLDISGTGLDRVNSTGNERGLLGLAFHPDYANNDRFFVNYTQRPNGDTVIAEYTAVASGSAANSEESRLMVIGQPRSNHNGGMIAFGPDGYLWIGMGDSGSGNDPDNDAQDETTLLGAMLRIDVDSGDPYAIPPDNPYVDSADGAGDPRREIWAIGLRNPWRWSFDAESGRIYIGDVGQNHREEVNAEPIAAAGLNYGWRVMEGTRCHLPTQDLPCEDDRFSAPIHDYNINNAAPCSIIGGYVYRGACMPDLQGWYFFGDHCSRNVWRLLYDGDDVELEDVTAEIGGMPEISSFGVDGAGEMYIISRRPSGTVYRIVLAD